jgi:hypothetical protein
MSVSRVKAEGGARTLRFTVRGAAGRDWGMQSGTVGTKSFGARPATTLPSRSQPTDKARPPNPKETAAKKDWSGRIRTSNLLQ